MSILIGLLSSGALLRILKPVKLVGSNHRPLIFERDETTGYSYQKHARGQVLRNFEIDNLVIINSDGFHDRERKNGNEGEIFRVAAIGDSFTAAMHVPIENMWTILLEEQLSDKEQIPTEVVNLGLSGTGTNTHFKILSSYLNTHHVDAVLLAFYKK